MPARRAFEPSMMLVLLLISWGVSFVSLSAQTLRSTSSLRSSPDGAAQGVEGCDWSADYFTAGPDLEVLASVIWDDGSGDALFIGGEFRTAGSKPVGFVAKWDGLSWSALEGASGVGTDGPSYALAVWDDGGGEQLYVGGDSQNAGGESGFYVASWDGSDWSQLGSAGSNGVNGLVRALKVYDDGGGSALYVGGDFTYAAGAVEVNHLAKWNGSAWAALTGPFDAGTDDDVLSLAVYDDGGGEDLYAGGRFDAAGGSASAGIARWDGTSWTALEAGTAGIVNAMQVHNDGGGSSLFLGGLTTASISSVITSWDGSQFEEVQGPDSNEPVGGIFALTIYDDGGGSKLYAGGDFRSLVGAGATPSNRVAVWGGSDWAPLSGTGGPGVTSHRTAVVRSFSVGTTAAVPGSLPWVSSLRRVETPRFGLPRGTAPTGPRSTQPLAAAWKTADSASRSPSSLTSSSGTTAAVRGCMLLASLPISAVFAPITSPNGTESSGRR